MSYFKDTPTLFAGLSVANQASVSVTPAIAATYNFQGWSFADGFTADRIINPAETSAAHLALQLSTLIAELYKRTSTHSGT